MTPAHAFLAGKKMIWGVGTPDAIINRYSDNRLERQHNFTQWAFPTTEASAFNPKAPVLTAHDVRLMKSDTRVAENLLNLSERMVRFYQRNDHWLEPNDHNHLRITRILKSLRLLTYPEMASLFYESVCRRAIVNRAVTLKTEYFWHGALYGVERS